MKKGKINELLLVVLIGCICSCDFDYASSLGYRTNGQYLAERTFDPATDKTENLDSNVVRQLLIFDADTMKIVRNDSVVEHLINFRKTNYVGRRKNGKMIFEGLTRQGRKTLMIDMENFNTMYPGNLTLGTIMKEPYDEKLDTLKTIYRPL